MRARAMQEGDSSWPIPVDSSVDLGNDDETCDKGGGGV